MYGGGGVPENKPFFFKFIIDDLINSKKFVIELESTLACIYNIPTEKDKKLSRCSYGFI